jgi:hypothetical protein
VYEPAYLLLSNNDGGFPQEGFYLKSGGKIINKTKTHYIELVKGDNSDEDYSGSMTQIYPHEMEHAIFSMFCPKATVDEQHL